MPLTDYKVAVNNDDDQFILRSNGGRASERAERVIVEMSTTVSNPADSRR